MSIFGLCVIYGCSTMGSKEVRQAEVPRDFPFAVVWLQPDKKTANINNLTERELLGLVIVKKWNEGDRSFTGFSMDDGKVYLLYPNIVYVKWENKDLVKILGPGGDDNKATDMVKEGKLPSGVQILDMNSSGINPYEYLSK